MELKVTHPLRCYGGNIEGACVHVTVCVPVDVRMEVWGLVVRNVVLRK